MFLMFSYGYGGYGSAMPAFLSVPHDSSSLSSTSADPPTPKSAPPARIRIALVDKGYLEMK